MSVSIPTEGTGVCYGMRMVIHPRYTAGIPLRIFVLFWVLGACSALGGWAQSFGTDILRSLVYTTTGGTELKLDLYRPMGTRETPPVVLAIPDIVQTDGSDGRESLDAISAWLASNGYAVAVITCRTVNDHPYPAQLEDTRAALRWLNAHAAAYHLNMQRLATLGMSGGAQLAALAAMQPQPNLPTCTAVVDLAGPMDLTMTPNNLSAKIALQIYLGGTREANMKRYTEASPVSYVKKGSPPFLIIHATGDPIIPYNQATRMASVLKAASVRYTLLPISRKDHDLPTLDSPAGQALAEQLVKFLHESGIPAAK